MKDICEKTGLSRGGLYRHYDSVEQIFLEIVNDFSTKQKDEISSKIADNIPATTILNELLTRYASEMMDDENSLSQAIYEFYSNPEGIFNLVIFSYQGVRMHSKLMKIDEAISNEILYEIKRLLVPEEV